MVVLVVLFAFSLCIPINRCSRVKIEDNGYTGILVSLPRDLAEEARAKLVLHVEAMFRSSSSILQLSTKGRAYFDEVAILVPDSWNIPEDDPAWERTSYNSSTFSEAGAGVTLDEVDLVITEEGQYPYVLHQSGCGQRGRRIILPQAFVLEDEEKGITFTRLWSEYRYGVFPEGGFKDDKQYPISYTVPGKQEEEITGCSEDRFWISNLCEANNQECEENSTSSIMDQNHPFSAKLFCEGSIGLGPHHNPKSLSKHNLICKEESTWHTVLRHSDFSFGKNAAPRYLHDSSSVSFHFVRQRITPKVVIAIETSIRMSKKSRFLLMKSPLYQFLYSMLPDGSEVTLFLFGGDQGVELVRHKVLLANSTSKLHFIESEPLPEDASDTDTISLKQLFEDIFQVTMNKIDNTTASVDIIVVTTEQYVDEETYEDVKKRIYESESRLHVMLFDEEEVKNSSSPSLYSLCQETRGHFTSLLADAFGDMQRGFGNVIRNSDREILIFQDYLKEDDTENLQVSFILDQSLTKNLKVYLSFQAFGAEDLQYKETSLQVPSGGNLRFLKMKMLNAWVIDIANPEVGEYVLKTRRKTDGLSPVLITVTGRPLLSEDPLEVNVWVEKVADSEITPAPVKILSEVRKGWNPVAGAHVTAIIRHPDGDTSQQTLLDDGLGDVDITRNDGIYGCYFTKFTTPGYYNVYIKVTEGLNATDMLTGPDNFCCGSFFPSTEDHPTGSFQREAGPFTFYVPWFKGVSNDSYNFPPSRVTDLRVSDLIDKLCILHWTAVGDDYEIGFASTYELKVFRDSAVIRYRFSDSGQELYSERLQIKVTPEAAYGIPLNHVFQLPVDIERGVYYIAIRAVDNDGNAGEPSNAVSVWIEESSPALTDCHEDEICENGECETLPRAAKLQGDGAKNLILDVFTFGLILANGFVLIAQLT